MTGSLVKSPMQTDINNMSKKTKERRIPKQKRSKQMVENILDTATALIADPNSPKLTTHLIAKTAGIAVGSVYQFFPNVATILESLIARVMDRLYDQLAEIWSSVESLTDLVEISEKLVLTTHDFYYQYPDVVNIIVASRNTEEFHEVNNALNGRLLSLITQKLVSVDPSLDLDDLRRKVMISMQLGDLMTMLIWTSETEEDRQAYLQEWQTITRIYTSNLITERA